MKIIQKVALAVIRNNKVMLVRSRKNKNVFYTLGGKPEVHETDYDCLDREVMEETNTKIQRNSLSFIDTIRAEAHDKINTIIELKLYTGNLIGDPKPSSEIEEIGFFDTSMSDKNRSILMNKVLNLLHDKGYIK